MTTSERLKKLVIWGMGDMETDMGMANKEFFVENTFEQLKKGPPFCCLGYMLGMLHWSNYSDLT